MRNSVILLMAAALAAIAPGAARGQQRWQFTSDDPGGGADLSSVRVDASATNSANAEESRSADGALMQAIARNDRPAAARLLDSEFTWVDRDGRSRGKAELADSIELLAEGPEAALAVRAYGRVALVTGRHAVTPDGAEAFFTRVWVRRGPSWRLLLYQETAPEDFSDGARYGVTGEPQQAGCENPCTSLPYKPLTEDAEQIVASFMAGEKALFEGDAEAAERILGDDVEFITAEGDQPMDKAQVLAARAQVLAARAQGLAARAQVPGARAQGTDQADPPAEVASMAVWVFGEGAVMSADQVSRYGERLRSTRIWAKRDGQWQLTFSQQTEVQ